MRILITGSSGQIGTRLAVDLAAAGVSLRLLDRTPPAARCPEGAEYVQADLRDLAAAEEAAAGTDAIIHLAGITLEAAFSEVVDHNIIGTHHVLEAARRRRVPRVVLASSHHVIGLLPTTNRNNGEHIAPDSFYAVSKVTLEALGRLYAHKAGLQVVAVRIGSFRDGPTEPRHRATWLSPRDATALLYAAATRSLPEPFLLTHGTSDNTISWWTSAGWDVLDYQPVDTADHHTVPGPLTDQWTGGSFADAALPT